MNQHINPGMIRSGPLLRPILLRFLLTGLCAGLLAGCRAAAPDQAAGKAPAQPLLFFQKPPCYGTCPAYEATFYENGSITYIGYQYAPAADTLYLHLAEPALQQLRQEIDSLHYTSLQPTYLSRATDRPVTNFTFYLDGKVAKRIKHQQGGPPELLQFQKMLETLLTELIAKKEK
ncbi:DUF6438 domain-containing protein [Pontibacter liquoris]|uniref:DUF6438 domain-containing protein n=1 Tax=Pontibacter liquoris TaxID=2905677 RepID=UPI001FA74B5B|nr:DUF6438 domain-containing protein [Pontibacter liquoris]